MVEEKRLINQTVIHKAFGIGVILDAKEGHLEVLFTEKDKTCKFGYPACFYGYLVLENEGLKQEVSQDVEQWREESGMATKEEMRSRYEKTMHRIEARRIAAEQKRQKAANRVMEHRFGNTQRANKKTEA